MTELHFLLRGLLGRTESPGVVCEEINCTRSAEATSFDGQKKKKKNEEARLDKEQGGVGGYGTYLFFFH